MKVNKPQGRLDYILFNLSKNDNFRERETGKEIKNSTRIN
jgi:hypothetical protein